MRAPLSGPRWAEGAVVGAGFAAAIAGLLGLDGGLLWVVFGVWSVRAVWGRSPGIAWGVACTGAGLRWGSFGLQDVQAATRSVGPTVLAGHALVDLAACVALAAAILEEARSGSVATGAPAERACAGLALLVLLPAYVVAGPGEPSLPVSLSWWFLSAAVLAMLTVGMASSARRVPAWTLALASLGGSSVLTLART